MPIGTRSNWTRDGRAALVRACLLALALALPGLRARTAGAQEARGGAAPDGARPRAEARVRALPTAELPGDPSSFASVIETDDYRGEAKTAADLLSDTVGVQVRRFGGPGQASEISIRGSTGQQVVILLDGVRLNSAQTGSVDLSTIPIDLVERIEVSRGGGSAQVGSDAIGGVVNIVTRRPTAEPRTQVAFYGGSFDTYGGSASHSRSIGEGGGLALGYEGFTTDGDWDFQTAEVQTELVTIPSREEERINNDAESHSALLRYSQELPAGWRMTLTEQPFFLSRGRPGLANVQNPDARERRTRNVAALGFVKDDWLEGDLSTDVRVSHRYEKVRFRDPDPPSPGTPIDGNDINRAGGGRVLAEWDVATGWLGHLATGRVELRRDDLDSREFGDRDRWVVGVFAQDELSVWDGRAALVPGLRFDYTEGEGTEWVPRAGARVEPWPWLRFKANVEKAYRVPNYDERFFNLGSLRGNPNLDPEESFDWDVGLEIGLADWGPIGELRLEAVYFDRDIDNSIVFQLVDPNTVAATNTDDASVEGVELAGHLTLFGWVELSGNYTRQDTDNDGDPVDAEIATGGSKRPLPGRAKDEWSLRAAVGPPSRAWRIAGEQHHTSRIPVSASGKTKVNARTTYDASLVLDVVKLSPWTIPWSPESALFSVVATNFTDRSVRDALGFPQPGRSITFRGELRW